MALLDARLTATDELDEIASLAHPLTGPGDLDPLLDRVGDARYVLLGEASHGTADYYRWRAEITRRLIVERGFSFVAVEGDWPDCFAVNRWVKGSAAQDRSARQVLGGFERWPTWMWANEEVAEFVDRLVDHHGPGAKAVVWEHNTHVGDARATDMARAGMVNVGQLVRERHGTDDVVLVRFGGHHGSVIAGSSWGAPVQQMAVPPAPPGTHEDLLHRATTEAALLVFGERRDTPWLAARRGHRAIGVVYDPAAERRGNWVPTTMGRRYGAFCYFDATDALHPLHLERDPRRERQTFPWAT